MNESINRRYTRNDAGAVGAPREDPLAELARIVNKTDPFSELFRDARTAGGEPAAGELRGSYDPHRQDASQSEAQAPNFRGQASRAQASYGQAPYGQASPAYGIAAYAVPPAAANSQDYRMQDPYRTQDPYGAQAHQAADHPAGAQDPAYYDEERYAPPSATGDDGMYDAAYDGHDGGSPQPGVVRIRHDEAVAAYDDNPDLYAPSDERLPAQQPRRRRSWRGTTAIAGVLACVVAGGVAFAWHGGFFGHTRSISGEPPLIVASKEPAKIVPEPAPADAQPPTKEIFDRVGQDQTNVPERVVSREEQPLALTPQTQAPPPRRAALRQEAPSAPPADDVSTAAPPISAPTPPDTAQAPATRDIATATVTPGEPRRVKTVKVLADGTIVTGEAPTISRSLVPPPVPAEEPDTAIALAPQAPPAAEPVPADSLDSTADVQPEQAAPQPVPPVRPRNIPPVRPKPQVAAAETPASDVAAAPMPAAAPNPTVAPKPTAAPKPAAVLQPAQPLAIPKPAQPAAQQVAALEAPVAAPTGGAFVVQVSSQKSQADAIAAFQGLQRKFPSVIGAMKPSIKKAEVADKGTFFRVRLGGWQQRDQATAFCLKLKAAGGDCVVARN